MDIERTMQFIVEQQAQLTASMQKHDEHLARVDQQIARNSEQIAKHDEQIGALTDLVGRLAQAEIRIVERVDNLHVTMTGLFERMDRFIQGLEGNGHKPQ